MPTYRATADGFMHGELYGPGRERPYVHVDKPFPKDKTPSWLELVEDEIKPRTRTKKADPGATEIPTDVGKIDFGMPSPSSDNVTVL